MLMPKKLQIAYRMGWVQKFIPNMGGDLFADLFVDSECTSQCQMGRAFIVKEYSKKPATFLTLEEIINITSSEQILAWWRKYQ
jgi:hypothetical protein